MNHLEQIRQRAIARRQTTDPQPIGGINIVTPTSGKVNPVTVNEELVEELAAVQDLSIRRDVHYCEMCGNPEREAEATMLEPSDMSSVFKNTLGLDEHTAIVMFLCWPCHRNMLKVSAHEIAIRQRQETERIRAKLEGDGRPEFPDRDQVDRGITQTDYSFNDRDDFDQEALRQDIIQLAATFAARRLP